MVYMVTWLIPNTNVIFPYNAKKEYNRMCLQGYNDDKYIIEKARLTISKHVTFSCFRFL